MEARDRDRTTSVGATMKRPRYSMISTEAQDCCGGNAPACERRTEGDARRLIVKS
ncbi:MAG: hypothetical protein ABW175_13870 [Bradyrhizobium sp.]